MTGMKGTTIEITTTVDIEGAGDVDMVVGQAATVGNPTMAILGTAIIANK